MRHLWHLFNIAMLLQLVGVFTADSTASKALHALAAIGFGFVARATRPAPPPTLPRRTPTPPRKAHRRG